MRLVCVYGVDEENRGDRENGTDGTNGINGINGINGKFPIKRSVTHLSYQAKRSYLFYQRAERVLKGNFFYP